MAVADVNGDGRPDLVTANSATTTCRVLLGNGDGTFQAPGDLRRRQRARSRWRSADVNGDGRPDLVTANYDTDDVSRAAGQRRRHLPAAEQTFAAGSRPDSVAVGDVNGDGQPDLVTANDGSGDVRVLLGNGDGTFRPAGTFAAGSDPVSVAVADVNGDGKPDLVTANYDSRHRERAAGQRRRHLPGPRPASRPGATPVRWRSATSTATAGPTSSPPTTATTTCACCWATATARFQARRPRFAAGDGPVSVAVGDVNGDGRPDLVTANYGYRRRVSVLLGNGDGTFRPQATLRRRSRPRTRWRSADVNGDGQPDLVTRQRGLRRRVGAAELGQYHALQIPPKSVHPYGSSLGWPTSTQTGSRMSLSLTTPAISSGVGAGRLVHPVCMTMTRQS